MQSCPLLFPRFVIMLQHAMPYPFGSVALRELTPGGRRNVPSLGASFGSVHRCGAMGDASAWHIMTRAGAVPRSKGASYRKAGNNAEETA